MNKSPFQLDKPASKRFFLFLTIVGFMMAFGEIIFPRTTAPTGRSRFIYELFGSYGLSALWLLCAFITLGVWLKISKD
jgi:hypothetical protein